MPQKNPAQRAAGNQKKAPALQNPAAEAKANKRQDADGVLIPFRFLPVKHI